MDEKEKYSLIGEFGKIIHKETIKIICHKCGEPAHEKNTFDNDWFFCNSHFEEGINAFQDYYDKVTGSVKNGVRTISNRPEVIEKNKKLVWFNLNDLNRLKKELFKRKLGEKGCGLCIHKEVCHAYKEIDSLLHKHCNYWDFNNSVYIRYDLVYSMGKRCRFFSKLEKN